MPPMPLAIVPSMQTTSPWVGTAVGKVSDTRNAAPFSDAICPIGHVVLL